MAWLSRFEGVWLGLTRRSTAACVEAMTQERTGAQTPSARPTRAQFVCFATLLVGAGVLAWSLSIAPGDALFYWATAALAVVWLAGAALAGWHSRHYRVAGCYRSQEPSLAQRLLTGLVGGVGLLGMFLAGAFVLAHIPVLKGPVLTLLDHADAGNFAVVLALTLINGAAEEVFFRGALFDAVERHRPVFVTTAVYTVVTAASGIWMLALAGLVLGFAAALLRQRTHSPHAPIVMHLTWSVGMIYFLPHVLTIGGGS